jgi:lipopolysaccharide transport system ATP-binding protein
MSDVIISVENLGKKYRISHQGEKQRYTALRDVIAQKLKAPFQFLRREKNGEEIMGAPHSPLSTLHSSRASHEDFWALRDVSFEVRRGEVVGIIGRNGAGKSTLLKILSRITEPTTGRVHLRGRVASLLEVGTGFHPELTGRENIFLNGAILGMSRAEIRKKFDEIVAFAEVEKFLDTPVKRYSSGMYVRLAFAVAAHLEPEILIVDEVLAVGDAQFQKKCMGKMQDVSKGGRTVLFVSHNMSAIQQLTQVSLLLQKGKVISSGLTDSVIASYFSCETNSSQNIYPIKGIHNRISCGREVEFVELQLSNSEHNLIPIGDKLRFLITIRGNTNVSLFRFGVTIFQVSGIPVGNTFSLQQISIKVGEIATYELCLENTRLAPGKYHCGISLGKGNQETGIQDFDIVLDVLAFEITLAGESPDTIGTWHPNWGAVCFPTPIVTQCNKA